MQLEDRQRKSVVVMFFVLVAFVALGNGLSDSVYANYFKDAYQVTAVQRGFIEFPRELPGLLCVCVITLLSSLGDIRTAFVAQLLSCVGLIALGLLTPSFGVMLVFLFINSMGMHLFMPVQDAIGMTLSEPGHVGKRMGQYASVRSAVGFVAGLLVFFGFRNNWFSFQTPTKSIFLIAAGAFLLAAVVCVLIVRKVRPPIAARKKIKFVFRRQYKYFYLLTILNGVKKQIAFVYGSWVIVDILVKGADTMALLIITSSFLCIFFMHLLGRCVDRFGIKKMFYIEALAFIFLYMIYGFTVLGITSGTLPSVGISVIMIYALFVIDRLSMQMGVMRSIYLRSIAWSDEEVTTTLSTGTSLDHVVSIVAALIGGYVWSAWGSQWVFFMAALFSLGNLYVAYRVQPEKEKEEAAQHRAELAAVQDA